MRLEWLKLNQLFKSEDSRFVLSTGLKFSGISILITILVGQYVIQALRLNYSFFTAHGYGGIEELGQAYYEFILSSFYDALPWLCLFYIFLFFAGAYIARMLLRPFRSIAEYCENVIENPNIEYNVDAFSDYRLLTRFSEFFFEYLRESRKRGYIMSNSIPPQYTKIHQPQTEKIFLLHFSSIVFIVSFVSAMVIHMVAVDIYENMVQLALKVLKTKPEMLQAFFRGQTFVVDELYFYTAGLVVVSYFVLSLHLYSQVSGAAFGIFATMRSFMKGNYFARVHLVGYGHIREFTRVLNKYLDYIQKNYDREPPQG